MAKKKFKLWFILDEEGMVQAISWAKTRGGALARYEATAADSRLGLSAEEVELEGGCALAPMAL